jgi:starch synthase
MTIRVLAVASEIFPLVKTGGLGDVVGALPAALKQHGIETRTLVPGYPAVMSAIAERSIVAEIDDLFGGPAAIVAGKAKALELYAIDAPHLYDRPGNPYLGPAGADWPDNALRFAALGYIAAEIGSGRITDFNPGIVHAHDWHAGLAPVYLRYGAKPRPKTIITIHNIAFQGQFPASIFPLLKLPALAFAIDGVEYYGHVSYLKGALQSADVITTVSPTYAEEICTPQGGVGLDGLLRARGDVLVGIVNGIDTDIWNPATDPALARQYDSRTLARRVANKRALEARFHLESGDGPLYCVVSRLTWQKGMDILAASIDTLVASGARLALLGTGEGAIEENLLAAGMRHKGRAGIIIGYDEKLSHLLQGGADAIVIPSRFEPCGLTQLYGLRYGCAPIVARVGGLADTLIDANEAALSANAATGIQFALSGMTSLENAISRANRIYRDEKAWSGMQRRGMKMDVSWTHSAKRYADLYRSLLGGENNDQDRQDNVLR